MICQTCEYCKSIKDNKGVYNITCDVNSSVSVHSTNAERFVCDEYTQRTKPAEPPKPNITVILKPSGRDIFVYCDMIKSPKALQDWWELVDKHRYFYIGGYAINPEDVSVVAYIGE